MMSSHGKQNSKLKLKIYPNERKSEEDESVLKGLHRGLGKQVRANSSGEKQSSGEATQMQVLSEKIRQVGPFHGLREPQERSLGFGELRIVVAMVVVVVVIVVSVLLLLLLLLVVVIGGLRSTAEVEEVARRRGKGREPYGGRAEGLIVNGFGG